MPTLTKPKTTAPCGKSVKKKNLKTHLKHCSHSSCLQQRQANAQAAAASEAEEKQARQRQAEAMKPKPRWSW